MSTLIGLWMVLILSFEKFGHIKMGTDRHEIHGFLRLMVSIIMSSLIVSIVGILGFILIMIM